MPSYVTEDIRNIALTGHGGSGKTTLMEALLYRAGAIRSMGDIEKGTTRCDFDPQERAHQHSLNSALFSLNYQSSHLNLIDTPGSPDFIGRALAVLPAVETAAVIINAQTGIETGTQKMMAWAGERALDRLIIVNQIDANVDLAECLEQIRDAFGRECLPMNLPADGAQTVIDCFFNPSGRETDFSSVSQAHSEIVDQVVELDEQLMELYLEQGQELSPEQLHDPFERALRDGHLIPVCFVSATTGAGIDELLRVFVELLPNPKEGNPLLFLKDLNGSTQEVSFTAEASGHVLAHVFKVAIDPFVGKIGFFRIHQGTVTKDDQLLIDDHRKPFKVSHLLKVQGKEHIEIPSAPAGDICAVTKVEDIHLNAVLHNSHEEDHIRLSAGLLSQPMYGLAVDAKTRGDEQKLSEALHKLEAEDPSLRIEHNSTLKETVIWGMGEQHLRIVLDTLKDRYNVDVEGRPPRIAYRETIIKEAQGHCRHKKQTGGAGQFGEVFLSIEPLDRGKGFEFIDHIVGGAIPKQFIPAVEKGIHQALEEGAIAGYPMQDIRVTVYDGKHHPVDSKEVAFITAGKKAFIGAVRKAQPVVLEPYVRLQINVPSTRVGDITADLSGKRGRINNTKVLPGSMTAVAATAPLSELESYQLQLKSLTGGEGSFSMEFSHYEPVPSRVQQQLMEQFTAREEE